MGGAKLAKGQAMRLICESLFNEFANHLNETGMCSHCASSDESQSEVVSTFPRLVVKVEKDFHVIGNEADGNNDHVARSARRLLGYFLQRSADIWFEPGLRWRSTTALIDQLPVGLPKGLGNEAG